MRKLLAFVALAVVTMTSYAYAMTSHYISGSCTPPVNGVTTWHKVIEIDQFGDIFHWSGRNCAGAFESGDCTPIPRTNDPGGTADTSFTGGSGSNAWIVNVTFTSGGDIDRIWGKTSSQEWWEGTVNVLTSNGIKMRDESNEDKSKITAPAHQQARKGNAIK